MHLLRIVLSATLALSFHSVLAQGETEAPKVAIVPFLLAREVRDSTAVRNTAESASLGALVADRLAMEFKSKYPPLRLAERRDLDAAVEQLKLDETNLFEDTGATRLGEFLKADYIIVGTIVSIGVVQITDPIRFDRFQGKNWELLVAVTGKLIDVKRGELITSVTKEGMERLKLDGSSLAPFISKSAQNASKLIAADVLPMFSPEVTATRASTEGAFIVQHGLKHKAQVGDQYRIYKILKVTDGFNEKELVGIGEITDVQPERSMVKLRGITTPKKEKSERFIAIRIARAG